MTGEPGGWHELPGSLRVAQAEEAGGRVAAGAHAHFRGEGLAERVALAVVGVGLGSGEEVSGGVGDVAPLGRAQGGAGPQRAAVGKAQEHCRRPAGRVRERHQLGVGGVGVPDLHPRRCSRPGGPAGRGQTTADEPLHIPAGRLASDFCQAARSAAVRRQ